MYESEGKNWMIKQIIKALNENENVNGYLITEKTRTSVEQFYVLQKLETTRETSITEYDVCVYHEFEENGKKYLGSSNFVISHKLSKKQLEELINDTVYAAKYVKNYYYNLVEGEGKKTFKSSLKVEDKYQTLNKIADTFFKETKENVKYNALELFFYEDKTHIVNSKGVNLTKTLNDIMVEAIPSYDGEKDKVEIIRHFHYADIDYEKIRQDSIEALNDVTYRYNAKKIENVSKIDVILRDHDLKEFFDSVISSYSYASVCQGIADKQVGEMVQEDVTGDLLTIGLKPSSKADAFDADGVLLKPLTIVENGKLVNNFGSNMFANYLNVKPTGVMRTLNVLPGKTKIDKLKKKPYIEIITLSGIQIEKYSHYIGGEVRLGLYFDGKDYYPVSGFSFSGNFDEVLKSIVLSKEKSTIQDYTGPKYAKLSNMDIL